MSKKQPTVKVKFENVPSHTVTGFFGGLNPNEGIISFFQDQLIPREGENPGEIVLDSIEQKFLLPFLDQGAETVFADESGLFHIVIG